jgi:proteasome accessory factor A
VIPQRLVGTETEYGLAIEGRGASEQLGDAAAVVRAYPGPAFEGWDYRFESPRRDLRGFTVDRLQLDPVDQQFERTAPPDEDTRADRVLANGARLYNDHGHPEYATPECFSARRAAQHDHAGEIAAWRAAQAYAERGGASVSLYKNNTDYHGASYGTHENYLVPRSLGYQKVFSAVLPILVARTVLCGAGKVGSENGPWCDFQLSQRADFLVETASLETLYRRPIFNSRDEPHADPAHWMRLHVICGDANRSSLVTERKLGLVRLALHLAEVGEAPQWDLTSPVQAFHDVSRAVSREARIEVRGRSWTTACHILHSYFDAAERAFPLCTPAVASDQGLQEMRSLIDECRDALDAMQRDPDSLRAVTEWSAKRAFMEEYMTAEGVGWKDPVMRALDLEYHRIHPEDGLYETLERIGAAPRGLEPFDADDWLGAIEPTRAGIRAIAIQKLQPHLRSVSWGCLRVESGGEAESLTLDATRTCDGDLATVRDVKEFIDCLSQP